jgi:hypothetical protein
MCATFGKAIKGMTQINKLRSMWLLQSSQKWWSMCELWSKSNKFKDSETCLNFVKQEGLW